jgi:hypothetical protein
LINNFVFYSGWKITCKSIEPVGWTFYIELVPPMTINTQIKDLKLEVGFFRRLENGYTSSRSLIDLCAEVQRNAIVETVAQYSRNRHDRSRAIREILGRDEELMTDIENSGEGETDEVP